MSIASLLLAAVISTVPVTQGVPGPAPKMKFPNHFTYQLEFAQRHGVAPVFKCDDTSRACMRGAGAGDFFVGEILAGDRETVLAHVLCEITMCTEFDQGISRQDGLRWGSIKQDIPWSCVEGLRANKKMSPLVCGLSIKSD